MAQFRLARLSLMLAALGLSAPALITSAHAQQKDAPAAAAAPKDTVRPEIFKLLDPAAFKQLLDSKNFTEAQSRITQAEAIANRTPYEDYVINRMKLSLGNASDNSAMMIGALEAVLASGRVSQSERTAYLEALGNANYNAKNYTKAAEWYERLQKEGGAPEKVRSLMVRSQIAAGNYPAAKEGLIAAINDAKKAGQKPVENDLRLLGQEANKAKDTASYMIALENLVQYYPTDDFWIDLLNRSVARKPGYDSATDDVNLLRLQFAAVKKMPPEHYMILAETALRDGFPAEAKKVLDAGFAAGELGTGSDAKSHTALRNKATKQAADDAKTIAAGEAGAAKSKTGAGLVNLGWAYTTMDQADKGVGFIQQGIAKGGLKNPDEAKLRLGMAQARAGKTADAIKTFESVKPGAGVGDIAKYWIVLLNHQQGGAAKTAAQ